MGYPWTDGQVLNAADLNAAVAGEASNASSLTLSGTLTVNGTNQSAISNGSLYVGQSDFRRSTFWSQGAKNQIAQFSRVGSAGTDVAQVQSFYLVNHNGGASGNIFNTTVSTSASNAPTAGTWNFLASLSTSSAYPNRATAAAATQVAGYSQAVRTAITGGTEGVSLIGHVIEMHDNVDQPSSTRGAALTLELDWAGNNVDDDDSTGVVSIDLSLANPAGSALLVGNGIGFYGGATTSLKRGIMAAVPFTQAFLDTRLATQGTGAHAIWLATNQSIALSSDGKWAIGSDGSGIEFTYNGAGVGSFDIFSNFHAPGGVTASGSIKSSAAISTGSAALDTRTASIASGGNAVWLADGQPIAMNTAGTFQQYWDAPNSRMVFLSNGGFAAAIDNSANMLVGGTHTAGMLVSPHVVGGNGSTITYSGSTQSGNSTYAVTSNVNLAGSLTAGSINPNAIIINSDTASVPVAPQGVNWFSVNGNFGGTGTQGCRTGIYSYLNMNGSSGGANDSFKQFNSVLGTFQTSANAGGTALTSGNTAGYGYGVSAQTWLLSGATFWSGAIGGEFDVGIVTGASSAQRTGMQVTSLKDGQGNYEDSAFRIGRGAATAGGNNKAPGWKIGVALGGWWPIDASGAVMQMLPPRPGGLSGSSLTAQTPAASLGIDLSGVQFSTAAFRSTGGFVVDGTGAVGIGGGKVSASGSALAVDATGSLVSAVTSVSGSPLSYVVNDVVWEPISGTVVTINTVDGSGVPLTWTVTRAGGVTGATFATAAFLGGTGNGITFNLTWTATTGLSLNPTGKHLGFNGVAPIAQPAAPVTLADVIAIIRNYGLSA